MIIFVVASGHEYTLRPLGAAGGAPRFRVMTYYRLFGRPRLPKASYIFTDFDRLGPWELQLASEACRVLADVGCRCLSNPARALGRHALLTRLFKEGINRFDAWRPELDEWPARYPVFLRHDDGHAGPLTDLIPDEKSLRQEIERLVGLGHPLRRLLIVEYAAEPIRPGLFRKYTMFRVGDAVFPHASEHGPDWRLKSGDYSPDREALYREEAEALATGPFRAELEQAFRVAGIEYGRADFGLVAGRPQIYEINTNPLLDLEPEAKTGGRRQTVDLFWQNLIAALRQIDPGERSGTVALDTPSLKQRRGRQKWFLPRERYGVRP
jgi:hypothetical protein